VFNCDRGLFAAKDLRKMTCYVCGAAGHLCCAPMDAAFESWNATSGDAGKKKSCCRCGGVGHVDSECAQGRRFGAFAENKAFAGAERRERRVCVFQMRRNGPHRAGVSGLARGASARGRLAFDARRRRRRVRRTRQRTSTADQVRRRRGRRRRKIRRKRRERPKRLRGAGQLGRGGRARRRRLGRRGAGRRATGRRRERGRARPRAGGLGAGETEVGAVLG
jgi:hypothetical protein